MSSGAHFAHVFEEVVTQGDVAIDSSTEANTWLVFAMEVCASGGNQLESARELAVLRRICGRVLAMVDLDALEADLHQAFEEAGKFRSALRETHGVRQ